MMSEGAHSSRIRATLLYNSLIRAEMTRRMMTKILKWKRCGGGSAADDDDDDDDEENMDQKSGRKSKLNRNITKTDNNNKCIS